MDRQTDAVDPSEHSKQLCTDLCNGVYECVVCSLAVGRQDRLWSCQSCHGVLHLRCVELWADTAVRKREKQLQCMSSAEEAHLVDKFLCPLCRAPTKIITTTTYHCYCGKVVDPSVDAMLVPGSCGGPCERRQADPQCPHRCTLLCHPGPCPPCQRTRAQACYCEKATQIVGCSSGVVGYECGQLCGKTLDCGNHLCESSCHEGPCPICSVMVEESCYCGTTTRLRRCARLPGFRCNKRCEKMRDCGHHPCGSLCHPGDCEVCLRIPSRQCFCPCGKTRVTVTRTSCLDPVPSCGLPCEMPLPCGHSCWKVCHDNSVCAPCKEVIPFKCVCGQREFSIPCFCQYLPPEDWAAAAKEADISPERIPTSYPPRCLKSCQKKLSCRKHKCSNVCCSDQEHLCVQICKRKLSCGSHPCGQLCHAGACPHCTNVSYERLYCRCHRTWLEPPIPCSTRLPRCSYPCIVPRPCGHPTNHDCHEEETCPLCVVSVERRCASHDAVMPYYMPCHLKFVSCGKRCGKGLACCGASCQLPCHGGPCTHKCSHKFPSFADIAKC